MVSLIDSIRNKSYFCKPVFRCCIFLMFIFFVAVVIENRGLEYNSYIECPEDSLTSCLNPAYECRSNYLKATIEYGYDCNYYNNFDCEDFCNIDRIEPGEYFGKKPGLLFNSAMVVFALLIVSAFLVNHLVYIYRRKKYGNKS